MPKSSMARRTPSRFIFFMISLAPDRSAMTMLSVISKMSSSDGRPVASSAAPTWASSPLAWNCRGERLMLIGRSTPSRSRIEHTRWHAWSST